MKSKTNFFYSFCAMVLAFNANLLYLCNEMGNISDLFWMHPWVVVFTYFPIFIGNPTHSD